MKGYLATFILGVALCAPMQEPKGEVVLSALQQQNGKLQAAEHIARLAIELEAFGSHKFGTCIPIEWKKFEKDKGLYRIYFLTVAHNVIVDDDGTKRKVKSGEMKKLEFFTLANPKAPWLTLDHIWIEKIHKKKDLAIIAAFSNIVVPRCKLATRQPQVGEWAMSAGCAMGEPVYFTEGRVVRPSAEKDETSWLTNAQAVFGVSGGPIFNKDMRVLGVTTKVYVQRMGLGGSVLPHMHVFEPIGQEIPWIEEVLKQCVILAKTTVVRKNV